MSTPQERFFSALNIAVHPSTKEPDIVAAIRGASRLLHGQTVAKFLGTEEIAELKAKLATSEAKLERAVKYVNELKIEIQRSQAEAREAKGAPPPPPPKPAPQPLAANNNHLSRGEVAWLSGVAGFILSVAIFGGLIGAVKSPVATIKQQAAAVRSDEQRLKDAGFSAVEIADWKAGKEKPKPEPPKPAPPPYFFPPLKRVPDFRIPLMTRAQIAMEKEIEEFRAVIDAAEQRFEQERRDAEAVKKLNEKELERLKSSPPTHR